MSPLRSPMIVERALGIEAVFAGQIDSDTARASDVVLWDDDAALLSLSAESADEEAPAAA